ncbi:zinc metalloproteinase nas-14 [Octopus sinensis]|uniref:Metalloendopeptidase n=1 Tax=Octopus sinensis TaxID=2607531 RepID=A0A6P7SZC5_9MOLL|nr:zinc metalloproteinase nas-14 [Octopus sinensis]
MFSSTKCLWITLLQVVYYCQPGFTVPLPPSDIGKNYQISKEGIGIIGPYSNKSIDQLITGALGGIGKAANSIVGANGSILAELDMMLNIEQFNDLYEVPNTESEPIRKRRKAVRNDKFRWTNGIIPYELDPYDFSVKDFYFIKRALTEWERYTCLKFVPARQTDKNRILFRHGSGCNSQLGMVGGVQAVNLDANGCRYKGLYLHEVGHAVGLVHEHQLPDRDRHIKIIYQNVLPSMRIWFNKYSKGVINSMNVPYELSSVMHYGITAFSYDGKSQTISALDKSREDEIGRVYQKELAYSDVEIVNKMYNCRARCPDKDNIKCLNGGVLDENCKCICPDGSQDCREGATVDANCKNKHRGWPCSIWANQGECERNPAFMEDYCRKSCGLCGEKADVKQGITEEDFAKQLYLWLGLQTHLAPEVWKGSSTCKNVYLDGKCDTWAANGDCLTNPKWMNKNCAKSCSSCPDTQRPSCKNTYLNDEKCGQWALEGECQLNNVWMEQYCGHSCRTCDKVTGGGGTDEEYDDCKDSEQYRDKCPAWAQANQCAINPKFMIPHCRMSCKKCQTKGCVNLYKDNICDLKAQGDQCESNKEFMRKNCRKSCKLCSEGEIEHDKKTTVYVEPTTSPTTKSNPYNCYDTHTNVEDCKMWRDNNHCNINPDWMARHCRKSCGFCSDSGRTTTTSSSCQDNDAGCEEWAKHDMCTTNARYMLVHCRKSCKTCGGCEDDNQLCAAWAKGHHCNKNAGYMLRHCRKSCNAC